MNGAIFGFQRWVWWPKWTPASRSWRIEISGSAMGLLYSFFRFCRRGAKETGEMPVTGASTKNLCDA